MKSILVVEDENIMRNLLEDSLSSEFAVTTVENGREAQDALDTAEYDLVITDLVMPEMNGIELIMSMTESRPQQKVLAISGGGGIKGRFDYLSIARLISSCRVLRKPFEMQQLKSTVHELLG